MVFLLTGKIPQELAIDPITGKLLWHNHVKHIDPKLIAIINRAIETNFYHRYSGAQEMLNAFGTITQNTPTINFPQPRVADSLIVEKPSLVDEQEYNSTNTITKKWHKAVIVASIVSSFSAFLWYLSYTYFPSQQPTETQSLLIPDSV